MALNFTGRPPQVPVKTPSATSRAPVMILACFGAAALLAGLVFLVALRQHKVQSPPPAPPLVGVAEAQAQPAVPLAVEAPPAAVAQPPAASAPAKPDAQASLRARTLAVLRQAPGRVGFIVENDPGAEAYAARLADLFRQAGWRVEISSRTSSGAPMTGTWAELGDTPQDEAIRQVFELAGIHAAPPPFQTGVVQTPEIFVGTP